MLELPVEIDPEIAELDFGEYEGWSFERHSGSISRTSLNGSPTKISTCIGPAASD